MLPFFLRGSKITPPSFEFALAPTDIKRLLGSKLLTAHRHGSARSVRVATVWHDTVGGALQARGLALAEQGGRWRLERLRPNGGGDWPPATASPCLGEAATAGELVQDMADPLIQVAAFTGTNKLYPLLFGNEAARLNVLQGTLRGVAREQPACRVQLAGTPADLPRFAADLAEAAGLSVPRAGLAAEAIAVAHGGTAAPRRLGAPAIEPGLTVNESLCRLTLHLADVILYWSRLAPLGEAPEPVHQMRVAVRRLRAALSLYRRLAAGDALADLGLALKDLARRLGDARDWDVFLGDTGPAVRDAFAGDARILAMISAAARKRAAAYSALRDYLGGEAWRCLALRLALLPTLQPWRDPADPDQAEKLAAPVQAHAAAMLAHAHRRLRQAGADFETLPPDELHTVRKQAKKLRYATEFYAPLFANKRVAGFLRRLSQLQEALGAVNDGHVAAALMGQIGAGSDRAFAAGAVQGYVAATRREAASGAWKSWAKYTRQEIFWS